MIKFNEKAATARSIGQFLDHAHRLTHRNGGKNHITTPRLNIGSIDKIGYLFFIVIAAIQEFRVVAGVPGAVFCRLYPTGIPAVEVHMTGTNQWVWKEHSEGCIAARSGLETGAKPEIAADFSWCTRSAYKNRQFYDPMHYNFGKSHSISGLPRCQASQQLIQLKTMEPTSTFLDEAIFSDRFSSCSV
jgi:hypothetical protein